jgi:TM2 domain-containing membrane protein YozV
MRIIYKIVNQIIKHLSLKKKKNYPINEFKNESVVLKIKMFLKTLTAIYSIQAITLGVFFFTNKETSNKITENVLNYLLPPNENISTHIDYKRQDNGNTTVVIINKYNEDDEDDDTNDVSGNETLMCEDIHDYCSDNSRQNQLTSFLLMFFLGLFGVGRCYLGYVACGIFKGLTCGGCMIWAIIDWILIVGGSLCQNFDGCGIIDNM